MRRSLRVSPDAPLLRLYAHSPCPRADPALYRMPAFVALCVFFFKKNATHSLPPPPCASPSPALFFFRKKRGKNVSPNPVRPRGQAMRARKKTRRPSGARAKSEGRACFSRQIQGPERGCGLKARRRFFTQKNCTIRHQYGLYHPNRTFQRRPQTVGQ